MLGRDACVATASATGGYGARFRVRRSARARHSAVADACPGNGGAEPTASRAADGSWFTKSGCSWAESGPAARAPLHSARIRRSDARARRFCGAESDSICGRSAGREGRLPARASGDCGARFEFSSRVGGIRRRAADDQRRRGAG